MNGPAKFPFRRVARITIEFVTPFHIGAGDGGDGLDALVVTDANGLPAIPGSSIAGVLRGAFRAATGGGSARVEDVFGFQNEDKGSGSRLSVSWGCIHSSRNEVMEGILEPGQLTDPVLVQALEPGYRDHVRLEHRGTAANRGKFDERRVCAGHRFSFELELRDCDPEGHDWKLILTLLQSGTLRFGGKTRRGYGACAMVEIHENSFDLRVPDQFAAYGCHPVRLARSAPALKPWTRHPSGPMSTNDSVTITLKLSPCGYWMFGGGEDLRDDPVEMAPLRDDRIHWPDKREAEVQRDLFVLPGSSLKGALSHRVAFHWNRLAGNFAERVAAECKNSETGLLAAEATFQSLTAENNGGVSELFGFATDKDKAQRGRVIFDDLLVPPEKPTGAIEKRIPHVAIDRFTGGARDQALFDERPLHRGTLPPWNLVITNASEVSIETRQALHATLDDLCGGCLALGAGAGRGHGFCEGEYEIDAPDWFNQSPRSSTTPTKC